VFVLSLRAGLRAHHRTAALRRSRVRALCLPVAMLRHALRHALVHAAVLSLGVRPAGRAVTHAPAFARLRESRSRKGQSEVSCSFHDDLHIVS
jgi:hypothetical protein